MKGCELCTQQARMYCESDRARLCSDCDEKVHSANFLVAKHSRSLLCHVCQSPTPWTASGTRLGSTISVCVSCAENQEGAAERAEESRGENEVRDLEDEDLEADNDCTTDDDDDDDDVFQEEEEDEEGENQVVPWPPTPPPAVASDSRSEDASTSRCGGGDSTSKRPRDQNAYLDSQDEIGEEATSFCSPFRSLKLYRQIQTFRSDALGGLEEREEERESGSGDSENGRTMTNHLGPSAKIPT